MLAKLKVLYEMFGLKMVDNELSDFLPLMLQFCKLLILKMIVEHRKTFNLSL